MELTALLEFAPQCCDASLYLQLGETCANKGGCYDNLRPMGAAYWFSLPYRLGLPPQSLIAAHLLLLVLSACLSVFAIRSLQQRLAPQSPPSSHAVLALLMLALHSFFFYPMLRTSLSDSPACLLALIGLWLLLIRPSHRGKHVLFIALGGLALGFAAWIRAFFLYPVLAVLTIWLLLWMRQRPRRWREIWLLTALIPISIQYAFTLRHKGEIAYLDPDTAEKWSQTHLSSVFTGYDTILPFDYHTWYAPCRNYVSLYEAAVSLDVKSVACVLAGRLYFYLGSYSPQSYLPPFEHRLPPMITSLTEWKAHNLKVTGPVSLIAEGSTDIPSINVSNAYQLEKLDVSQSGELLQKISLERNHIYQLLASFWSSNHPQQVDVTIKATGQEKVLANCGTLMAPLPGLMGPMDCQAQLIVEKSGDYTLGIHSGTYDVNTKLGQAAAQRGMTLNQKPFYMWDAKLIKIPLAEPTSRKWSLHLLLINFLIVLLAIFTILKTFSINHSIETACILFIPICFGIALILTPEQRFMVMPLVGMASLAIAYITKVWHTLKSMEGM